MTEVPATPLNLTQLGVPSILADPYPFYHHLRDESPVLWDDLTHSWLVMGYEAALACLRDARLSAVRTGRLEDLIPPEQVQTLTPVMRAIARQMLFLDPPDHTRLRRLVHKAFTPRVVEEMRASIQQMVDERLDAVADAGHMELIADLAHPLPATVIAHMLGVPERDQERFIRWGGDFGLLLNYMQLTPEIAARAMAGVAELITYLRQVAADHQENPRDDLMQGLLQAREVSDTLDEDELIGNCVLLLSAGHVTTTHLISNGLWTLLRHPDQRRRLEVDPALWPSAVLELLRYEGPVQITGRIATADLEVGGRGVRAGERVAIMLGAVNRDPNHFPDPDRLDVGRSGAHQVAFGQGIHFCLGAPLAKIEGEIALRTILQRFPAVRPETDVPDWESNFVFRGLRTLPLALA